MSAVRDSRWVFLGKLLLLLSTPPQHLSDGKRSDFLDRYMDKVRLTATDSHLLRDRDDQERGNSGGCQSRHDTSGQGGEGQPGDITTTAGGQLRQDTNLDTERANVAESTEGVRGNEVRTRRQLFVQLQILQLEEGNKLVLWVFHVSKGPARIREQGHLR